MVRFCAQTVHSTLRWSQPRRLTVAPLFLNLSFLNLSFLNLPRPPLDP